MVYSINLQVHVINYIDINFFDFFSANYMYTKNYKINNPIKKNIYKLSKRQAKQREQQHRRKWNVSAEGVPAT